MKKVIYDFIDRPAPGTVIDGSGEYLPPEDQVTAADLASPFHGLLRDEQQRAGDWPAQRPARWRRRAAQGKAAE